MLMGANFRGHNYRTSGGDVQVIDGLMGIGNWGLIGAYRGYIWANGRGCMRAVWGGCTEADGG